MLPDTLRPEGRAMQMMRLDVRMHHGNQGLLPVLCHGVAVLLVPLLISACVNIVAQNAPAAMQTVESRARFELNCPNVQATILSQKIVQGWRFDGSEHTIGVRGCDRQAVYVVYCADPSNCNAFSQTGRVANMQNLMP